MVVQLGKSERLVRGIYWEVLFGEYSTADPAQQPSATQATADDVQTAVNAIYKHGADLMKAGKTRDQIVDDLVSTIGLERTTAETVTTNLLNARSDAMREQANKNMLHGALWCVGGAAVTFVTYAAVSSSGGGGTYIVTWGAMGLGAIQFLQGVWQRLSN